MLAEFHLQPIRNIHLCLGVRLGSSSFLKQSIFWFDILGYYRRLRLSFNTLRDEFLYIINCFLRRLLIFQKK